jgi:hypothetical protein
MKEQISTKDLLEIKGRIQALSVFQSGAISIPLGVLWLGLGMTDLLDTADRKFHIFAEWRSGILNFDLFLFLPALLIVTVLIGFYLYSSYNREFGTWLPYLGMPIRFLVMSVVLGATLGIILFLQYLLTPTFPWLGLAVGIIYSALGVMEKPRRRYYPAIALTLMGVSFLPLLFGADGMWTRNVCYITYGLTLVLIGWIDHRNLIRLHLSLTEEKEFSSFGGSTMKEQISVQDVYEIKGRVQALSTFQMGAISIPLGVLWLIVGLFNLLMVVDLPILVSSEAKGRGFLLLIGVLLFCFSILLGVILIGSLQFLFYTRKFGTWLPYLGLPIGYWPIIIISIIIISSIMFLHYVLEPTFPWMGLAIGIFYSAAGMIPKSSRRWYYPAIALPLMGVSFLPLLLGGDGLWTRIVCFLTYGLTLVFIGWIDHRNLMRLHQSMAEVPDGKSV